MSAEGDAKVVTVVDNNELMRNALLGMFKAAGLPAREFASAEDFLASGIQYQTTCLIADVRTQGMSGLELQATLNADHCSIPTIFITAHGDTKMKMEALRAGAVEFQGGVAQICSSGDGELSLSATVRSEAKGFDCGTCRQPDYGSQDWKEPNFARIIGNSPALEAVLEQVERVAPTDSTVLIQGETGTGKELIAHATHNLSSRVGRAFVRVN